MPLSLRKGYTNSYIIYRSKYCGCEKKWPMPSLSILIIFHQCCSNASLIFLSFQQEYCQLSILCGLVNNGTRVGLYASGTITENLKSLSMRRMNLNLVMMPFHKLTIKDKNMTINSRTIFAHKFIPLPWDVAMKASNSWRLCFHRGRRTKCDNTTENWMSKGCHHIVWKKVKM